MKEINIQDSIKTLPASLQKEKQAPKEQDASFEELLNNSIDEVNRLHKEADRAVMELATGNEKDIHNTMIALEKAGVSFRLMMQVRNKIVSAYQEIMRMQV